MRLFGKNSPLIAAILPKVCIACDKRIPENEEFCSGCYPYMKRISIPACDVCGKSKKRCPSHDKSTNYNFICAPFYYRGAIRAGLRHFKFGNRQNSADFFADQMAKYLIKSHPDIKFDYITYVPMTEKQIKDRGFNQSQVLAQRVAKILNVECRSDILIKLYNIEPQHNLSAMYRKGNVAGVFDVENREIIKNKNILIVDDIKTTGYTVDECAKMLKQYDAAMVGCLCAAIVI
ncbi:MAG: ComF family protein [Clostridia bacterium]|nr:ComF family protein [Clostridia bacterium]